MAKNRVEVVFTPEQFAQMSADDIALYIRRNENTAIIGEKSGIDRHIIRYRTHEDWFSYVNPY